MTKRNVEKDVTETLTFPEIEEKMLSLWIKNSAFEQSNVLSEKRPIYTFFDGPPFATGLPHYGHILSGTIKDTVTRFYYQQKYHIVRKFGWDCHGLPVEYEIDKKLGINTREEVLKMGIDVYNQHCRDIVMTYSHEWEKIVTRLGRWISFKDGYRTMDTSFMESVWNIFKMLYDKDLIYRGFRVMPFSTACSTPVSNFEANQNYKEVSDPSVLVKFPLLAPFHHKKISLLAWTTTPWTLPSNCALLINKSITYGIFEYESEFYIMSVDRLSSFNLKFTESSNKKIIVEPNVNSEEILNSKFIATFPGTDLLDLEYEPPFSYFSEFRKNGYFKIYAADFVSNSDGTGIVHCAPAFGEEDYRAFVTNGIINENDMVPCPVDDKGRFTSEIKEYEGIYVKEADKIILKDLKSKILQNNRVVHRYPFCWRSDTPLIYKLVPNWFVKVKNFTERLLRNNELIKWVPATIKYKKFHNWLMNAKDWSISRNRFWGTPLPIWTTKDYNKIICFGSLKELEEYISKYGNRKEIKKENPITDIHREFIDGIVFNIDNEEYKRVDEVLDCWFESGSMPYAQNHWPFNGEDLNMRFPADFIGEGVDQTRGWFYTLHVISSLLFDKPAFKNVVVNGIVLAEDGKKMSKRLKNYPDPMEVVHNYGADSLRMYLISSPVVEAENLRFGENGVKEILKNLIIPWHNALNFYLQCISLKRNVRNMNYSCLIENPLNKTENNLTPMDKWILTSFNNLTFNITKKMKEYAINGVLNYILVFIDDLTNWYIRINRKELKEGKLEILGYVLVNLSIIMSPFTPFYSEYCFQEILNIFFRNQEIFPKKVDLDHEAQNSLEINRELYGKIMKGEFASVHYFMYPIVNEIMEHSFEKAKEVIEGVRTMRVMHSISLKTPLKTMKVVCNEYYWKILESYKDVIKRECNIIHVEMERENAFRIKMVSKPNFKEINNKCKDKKEIGYKIQVIRSMNDEEIKGVISSGKVVKDGVVVFEEELIVERVVDTQNKEISYKGWELKLFTWFSIILDTRMTNELLEMKEAREFNSFYQKMRKSAGLNVQDNVFLSISGSEDLIDLCKKFYDLKINEEKGEVITTNKYKYKDKDVDVTLSK